MMVSRHNLPADIASFVGRERELAELRGLLLHARLLTLTGTGGSGKTRLALRLAADTSRGFADGVWLVQLGPITNSSQVPRAVASALGVRGTSGRPLLTTLATAVAPRRLLLVLDNCEHLLGACARLAETLLRACPHLRILATSREPLRVGGEVTWRVPPLALPEDDPLPPLESLAQIEAVTLFLTRARARQPTFTLTTHNAPAIAAICRELAGLPLGIELAAAQLGPLSPEQIATRLDDALRLLGRGSRTQPRQETLQATLDWSHALLSEAERVLFRRLSVFAGNFSLEAAEDVCAGDGIERAHALTLLAALVEKSLVEPRTRPGDTRYRLLEPVRQYAWARLTEAGEAETVQRRHAEYLLTLTETAEPWLMSGERGPWMARLAEEQDNLRAALGWSRQTRAAGDREIGLRLAGALVFFWSFRGDTVEGLEWTETALAGNPEAHPSARAKALYGAGEMAWLAGQTALARTRAEEGIGLWRSLGDKRRLAYALQSLPMSVDHPRSRESTEESLRLFEAVGDEWGAAMATGAVDLFALIRDGDPTGRDRTRLEEAVRRFRRLGDNWAIAQMLNILGDLSRSQGDDARAIARYDEALALLRREGLTGTVPSLLQNSGYLALGNGDVRRSLRLFREALILFRDQGDQRGVADCLDGLAGVLAAMNQPEKAVRLFGVAEALRVSIGATVWPANLPAYERSLDAARGRLDEAAFAAAWAAGHATRWEQAVAEILAPKPSGVSDASADGFDLTSREREVAVLVAEGLTNRQIGARLVITEGTARLHVKHILQKLGFTSRAQIAAWAVDQGLAQAPETS